MMERYAGIPQSTLSTWVYRENEEKSLKLPFSKLFRYIEITGQDGKPYSVVKASDWFSLAVDLLVNPGKTGKGLRVKLGDFIGWFAVKGFYAESYIPHSALHFLRHILATKTRLFSNTTNRSLPIAVM